MAIKPLFHLTTLHSPSRNRHSPTLLAGSAEDVPAGWVGIVSEGEVVKEHSAGVSFYEVVVGNAQWGCLGRKKQLWGMVELEVRMETSTSSRESSVKGYHCAVKPAPSSAVTETVSCSHGNIRVLFTCVCMLGNPNESMQGCKGFRSY